jgi:hypothetical protein
MTAKKHLIFRKNVAGKWTLDCVLPYIETDGNHGLPDRFFDLEMKDGNQIINFEVDVNLDKLEWWPAIGPAPHWSVKWSDFAAGSVNLNDGFTFVGGIMEAFEKWMKETY